jgi:hypothetical protein
VMEFKRRRLFRRLENSKGLFRQLFRQLEKSKEQFIRLENSNLKDEHRMLWASLDHNINKSDSSSPKHTHLPT